VTRERSWRGFDRKTDPTHHAVTRRPAAARHKRLEEMSLWDLYLLCRSLNVTIHF
jgi:hypothetical protein